MNICKENLKAQIIAKYQFNGNFFHFECLKTLSSCFSMLFLRSRPTITSAHSLAFTSYRCTRAANDFSFNQLIVSSNWIERHAYFLLFRLAANMEQFFFLWLCFLLQCQRASECERDEDELENEKTHKKYIKIHRINYIYRTPVFTALTLIITLGMQRIVAKRQMHFHDANASECFVCVGFEVS